MPYDDPYAVAEGSDGLVQVANWIRLRELDSLRERSPMRNSVLLDAVNMLDAERIVEAVCFCTDAGGGVRERQR